MSKNRISTKFLRRHKLPAFQTGASRKSHAIWSPDCVLTGHNSIR